MRRGAGGATALVALVLALPGCGGEADAPTGGRVAATTTLATTSAAGIARRAAAPTAARDPATTRTGATSATTAAPPPAATTSTATGAPPTDDRPLRGRVVLLDPGHNGGNAAAAGRISRTVSIGTGTKACDTVGTQSVRGLPEHRYTWLVVQHVRRALRSRGARVVLTRADDAGVGPCITRRMPKADRVGADLAVSIHGDGGPSGGRGFHVILPGRVPQLRGHDRIVAPSARLGRAVRAAFRRGTGMPYSTYLGRRGLDVRTDLGGLNLIRVPGVMVETGNMRNATDAGLMGDPAWRRRAGVAIADGITRVLEGSAR